MQGARCHRVKILRDTGAAQTMVLQELVGKQEKEHVICRGVGGERFSVPLAEVKLTCSMFKGNGKVGLVDSLPIKGVQVLLGNDLVHGTMSGLPVMCSAICRPDEDKAQVIGVTTRAQAAKLKEFQVAEDSQWIEEEQEKDSPIFSERGLETDQRKDQTLERCFKAVQRGAQRKREPEFYLRDGILMRRWKDFRLKEGEK